MKTTPLARILLTPVILLSATTVATAAGSGNGAETFAADSVATSSPLKRLAMPLDLTAADFVTKVYGVLDPGLDSTRTSSSASERLGITPTADNTGLWIETADGYCVSYYGLQPECSAMASFDEGAVSDFAFFFLFPYTGENREEARRAQAEFCGSLLQELADIGAAMGLNEMYPGLFEAVGEYAGNLVEVRLDDQPDASEGPRYVLSLRVEPRAFTAADDLAAN